MFEQFTVARIKRTAGDSLSQGCKPGRGKCVSIPCQWIFDNWKYSLSWLSVDLGLKLGSHKVKNKAVHHPHPLPNKTMPHVLCTAVSSFSTALVVGRAILGRMTDLRDDTHTAYVGTSLNRMGLFRSSMTRIHTTKGWDRVLPAREGRNRVLGLGIGRQCIAD